MFGCSQHSSYSSGGLWAGVESSIGLTLLCHFTCAHKTLITSGLLLKRQDPLPLHSCCRGREIPCDTRQVNTEIALARRQGEGSSTSTVYIMQQKTHTHTSDLQTCQGKCKPAAAFFHCPPPSPNTLQEPALHHPPPKTQRNHT